MEKNRKMIVLILIFAVAMLLTAVILIKNIPGRKTAEDIRSFETINLKISGMRGTREYEIICRGDDSEISLYRLFYANGKDERRLEKSAVISTEEMIEILNSCGFAGWDGFNGEHPKNVSDGEMFSLVAIIGEGRTIKAEGSANFPKGYREFIQKIDSVLAEEY